MAYSEKIQAADAEGKARAEAGDAARRIERRGAAADISDLGAHADIHGIASGLLERVEDILVGLIAIRILNGCIHARKDPEIVQPALALVDLAGGKRIARRQADAVAHQ